MTNTKRDERQKSDPVGNLINCAHTMLQTFTSGYNPTETQLQNLEAAIYVLRQARAAQEPPPDKEQILKYLRKRYEEEHSQWSQHYAFLERIIKEIEEPRPASGELRLGPTYYVRHPDDSYSVADPQPSAFAASERGQEWGTCAFSKSQHKKCGHCENWMPLPAPPQEKGEGR